MISFRRFALRRGSRLLLSDIDLVIQTGWRLGVVGRNGCGKSSLGSALAEALALPLIEGDDFHASESVAKMSAVVPSTVVSAHRWMEAIPWPSRGSRLS